jgi:hypothetical protein
MSGSVKISTKEFQKNVLFFAVINSLVYAFVLVILRFLNLRNVSGLIVPLDNIILCLISFYQIKKLVHHSGIPLKFLRSFSLVFFTGVFSFIFFGAFILVYSWLDPGIIPLFRTNTYDKSLLTPAIVTVAEGIGGSIIVALIGMMYADRYADHEAEI